MPGKRMRNVSIASYSGSSYSGSDDENSSNDASNNRGSESPEQNDTKRRGRAPSKRPCLNRNAMMARVNRQRKKEYVEDLEKKLSHYQQQNRSLNNKVSKQEIDLKRLNAEVSYLKNVLNNNSSITALLKTMNNALSKNKKKNVAKSSPKIKPIGNNNISPSNIEKKSLLSLIDESDHDYTCDFIPSNEFNLEDITPDSSPDYFLSQFVTDDVTLSPTSEFDSGIDTNSIFGSSESNQLGSFDSDMFDLPSNIMEHEDTNLFDNLDSTGVCLHVNSGKVSLEFCSVCHLNSIHSDES